MAGLHSFARHHSQSVSLPALHISHPDASSSLQTQTHLSPQGFPFISFPAYSVPSSSNTSTLILYHVEHLKIDSTVTLPLKSFLIFFTAVRPGQALACAGHLLPPQLFITLQLRWELDQVLGFLRNKDYIILGYNVSTLGTMPGVLCIEVVFHFYFLLLNCLTWFNCRWHGRLIARHKNRHEEREEALTRSIPSPLLHLILAHMYMHLACFLSCQGQDES